MPNFNIWDPVDIYWYIIKKVQFPVQFLISCYFEIDILLKCTSLCIFICLLLNVCIAIDRLQTFNVHVILHSYQKSKHLRRTSLSCVPLRLSWDARLRLNNIGQSSDAHGCFSSWVPIQLLQISTRWW